jgi:hypothetical protein
MTNFYQQDHFEHQSIKHKHHIYNKNNIAYVLSNNKVYHWPFPVKKYRFINHLHNSLIPPTQSSKNHILCTDYYK